MIFRNAVEFIWFLRIMIVIVIMIIIIVVMIIVIFPQTSAQLRNSQGQTQCSPIPHTLPSQCHSLKDPVSWLQNV